MLGSPQTFLDDDKSATANVTMDFRTDMSTPSQNDSSKLASKEESEVTLAVGRYSRHIYVKVIFNYLHISRNFVVKQIMSVHGNY
jgi:hypothetical protein